MSCCSSIVGHTMFIKLRTLGNYEIESLLLSGKQQEKRFKKEKNLQRPIALPNAITNNKPFLDHIRRV